MSIRLYREINERIGDGIEIKKSNEVMTIANNLCGALYEFKKFILAWICGQKKEKKALNESMTTIDMIRLN